MSSEKIISSDLATGGLIASTHPGEAIGARGRFDVKCIDKDGNLKWEASNHNLVVNVGLQYLAGSALTSTAQITTWYIGLYGAGASNNPAAGDTAASHAGWTENTTYSNATRVAATFTAATAANPSVVTNSASPASFSINGTTTVGGAFLISNSTKGGTTGTLFSAADFQSPGDRSVVNGDTVLVTYTLNVSG